MITPEPPRLIEQNDALADILRQAAKGYDRDLDPPSRAYLVARGPKPALTPVWWLALAGATAAAALLVFQHVRAGRQLEFGVTAEALSATLPQAAKAPDSSSRQATPELRKAAERAKAAPRAAANEDLLKQKPMPSAAPASSAVAPAAEHSGSDPAPASLGKAGATESETETCLGFARSGEPKRAAECFSERAQGSGLSAQVALYELSRLQRDALGEPAAALDSLNRYLERFPSGSLGGEARFSRLELLARLGRTTDAIEASREFLASPFGAERAPEVHLLRGNLFQRSGSAASAVSEYAAAVNAPGRVGDDAAFQLGAALEKNGQRAEAMQAYERYLARGKGRHRSAVEARLKELSP